MALRGRYVAAVTRSGSRRVPQQRQLLLAAALIVVGSFLPWVDTPFRDFSGMNGAGVWTFYAGVLALAGALVPSPRVAAVHALLAGVVAAALPVWQVARLVRLGIIGQAIPSIGLVIVLGAGVIALGAGWGMRTQPRT
jgi:hypothetical protein